MRSSGSCIGWAVCPARCAPDITALTHNPVAPSVEPRVHSFAVTTSVEFDELSGEAIQAYIASGEPFDKAGSYGEATLLGRA